jgi:hypothetical protein
MYPVHLLQARREKLPHSTKERTVAAFTEGTASNSSKGRAKVHLHPIAGQAIPQGDE